MKTRITKQCEVCEKDFTAYQYSLRQGRGRFCSLTCKGKALRTEKKNNCTCVRCGKAYYRVESRIKDGGGRFCSKSCAFTGRIVSEETRKKQSIAKDRGLTPLNKSIRRCFEYRFWRSTIFLRDNFTCVLCTTRGGEIQADHYPNTFATILRDNKITSVGQAENCVELWDIENGRTLCRPCHQKTETWGKNIKHV